MSLNLAEDDQNASIDADIRTRASSPNSDPQSSQDQYASDAVDDIEILDGSDAISCSEECIEDEIESSESEGEDFSVCSCLNNTLVYIIKYHPLCRAVCTCQTSPNQSQNENTAT